MRPLLIVLAGACASIGTSLAVYAAVQLEKKPYVEVLQGGLVRTNADEMSINTAVAKVLTLNRPPAASIEDALEHCDYQEHGDAWFASPDFFGHAPQRACRLVREQTDRLGRPLKISVLQGDEMPTLVFIEHEEPEVLKRVACQLAFELGDLGFDKR